ncbi:unnamed protein product [Lactuca virosa]|uniref:Uncharacterized protein n=1 Tax=Lactuca virosa TaxID=75947 RepID=A0AAU9M6T8_9ASTR|nr:unnamed protein product [Lactuca virosa]
MSCISFQMDGSNDERRQIKWRKSDGKFLVKKTATKGKLLRIPTKPIKRISFFALNYLPFCYLHDNLLSFVSSILYLD